MPLAIAVLTVAALVAPSVRAQRPSLDQLTKARNPEFTRIAQLRAGTDPPPSAKDEKTMEVEAQYLVLRFYAPPPIDMVKLHSDVTQQFITPLNQSDPNERLKRAKYVGMMYPVLVKQMRYVFDAPLPDGGEERAKTFYALTNLAHTLPQFARVAALYKEESFGDYLIELLADHEAAKGKLKNKHDLVKMYAARALREYLPVTALEEGGELTPNQAKRKARELAYVDALAKFIERPGMDKLPDDEQAAMHFVRREVIETLAHAKAAAIVTGTKQVEGPIAPTLLKVLSPKSGLDLTPDLAERLEAAIGVAQMNLKYGGEYQGELGIYLVARFIAEFVTEYNKDLVLILAKTGDESPRGKLEWRIQAKRLEVALQDMAKNAKGQPYAAKAEQLEKDALLLLRPMQDKKQDKINQGSIKLFADEAVKYRPKTGQVYRNVKTYVIELEAAPAAAP
jgi:hypothetical protein